MGNVSLQISHQMLPQTHQTPPSSIIHDDAYGNGVVSQAIIESQDSVNIIIHTTDIGPSMCAATSAKLDRTG